MASSKLDFDWGYGPLHYFSPSAHLGGPDGLRGLVDACHGVNMAVILDIVYQHVDPGFAYKLVYDDVNGTPGAPRVSSPMIGAGGLFGRKPISVRCSRRNILPQRTATGSSNITSMAFAMTK